MGTIKKLASDTAIYGVSSILGRIINWLLVPVYTRVFVPPMYDKAEYGIQTTVMAFVAVLLALLTYGMETGYFRFASKSEDKESVYSTILVSLLCTSLFFLFIVLAVQDPIAGLLHIEDRAYLVGVLAFTLAIDAFSSIPFARLRLENRPVKFATIKFLNILINVGANLFFLVLCPWIMKHHPNSFIDALYTKEIGVGYVFISYLIASSVTLLMLAKEIGAFRLQFDKVLFKQIFRYSFPILLVSLAGILNINLDKMLLPSLLKGDAALSQTGDYGASYKLAVIMTLFTQAYRYAFEPFFFSKKKDNDAKKIYADALKYFTIIGLIVFLGVIFYLDIIKLFLGKSFHEGLSIIPVILMANLFMGIYYSLSLWYKLTDKTIYGSYLALGGVGVTLALNVLLVPQIGYIGAAYASLACFIAMTVVSYLLGQKHFPVPYDLRTVFLYFFIALALFFVEKGFSIESLGYKMLVNTCILAVFLVFVVYKEQFNRKLKSKPN